MQKFTSSSWLRSSAQLVPTLATFSAPLRTKPPVGSGVIGRGRGGHLSRSQRKRMLRPNYGDDNLQLGRKRNPYSVIQEQPNNSGGKRHSPWDLPPSIAPPIN